MTFIMDISLVAINTTGYHGHRNQANVSYCVTISCLASYPCFIMVNLRERGRYTQ